MDEIKNLQDLAIQKSCEIGELIMILRKQNEQIKLMHNEIKKLKNLNSNNHSKFNYDLTQEESNIIEIFRIYNRLMLRDPEPSNLLKFLHELELGKSLEWIEQLIKSSKEYRKRTRIEDD